MEWWCALVTAGGEASPPLGGTGGEVMSILKMQSSEERNRLFQVEEMAGPKAQKEKRARRIPKNKKKKRSVWLPMPEREG